MKTASPSAEDKAALWAARLDGSTLSATDRLELDAWLAENPRHRALLTEYCQFSADLEQQLPALVDSGQIALPPRPPRAPRNLAWLFPISLAIAAAFIALLVWSRPRIQKVATATGQRQTLTLSDGTRVDLNAHTTIAVEFRGGERHVQLAEGEAFFTVSKDKSRPFIVDTPAGSVRVTGTVFDVRSEATHDLRVMVEEGSVQVRAGATANGSSSAPYALTPGDVLTASVAHVSRNQLPISAIEEAVAWRHGEVVFNATPLGEALERFARYHGRGIVATPEAAALKLSGRYSLDDLEGFFANIEQVLPVQVSRDLAGTIHVALRAP